MNSLKKIIYEKCFTKTNKLNNRVCIESWWINNSIHDIYQKINSFTDHLGKDLQFSERIYIILNDIKERPKCQQCHINFTGFMSYSEGYRDYCSPYCATQNPKRNRKIVENTNRENVVEQMKKTNLEKYGVLYTTQLPSMISKTKQTKLDRYGDDTYSNPTKTKKTNLTKYGFEYTAQVPEIIEKIQKSKGLKYPNLRNKEWLIEQNKTKSIQQIAIDLDASYRTVYLWFKKYNIDINFFSPDYSNQQSEVQNFLMELGIENIRINDRNTVKPKELDMFLPEHKLAIEYNGMYWHAEDKYRHIQKYNLCHEKGIKLLQIWDTEWLTKREIVKSIIKTNIGLNKKIYARKCAVEELNFDVYSEFLENNHIQGSVNTSLRYGLFFEGNLVSVIGLGKSRYSEKYDYELLRFCTKLGYTVIGGFSKLMTYAKTVTEMKTIVSFCDIRLFDGSMYEKNGFVLSHQTKPGYCYYKQGIVKSRFEFQKHKLKDKLDSFDESLSEHQNMNRNGWLKVWDCGQKVYVKK